MLLALVCRLSARMGRIMERALPNGQVVLPVVFFVFSFFRQKKQAAPVGDFARRTRQLLYCIALHVNPHRENHGHNFPRFADPRQRGSTTSLIAGIGFCQRLLPLRRYFPCTAIVFRLEHTPGGEPRFGSSQSRRGQHERKHYVTAMAGSTQGKWH